MVLCHPARASFLSATRPSIRRSEIQPRRNLWDGFRISELLIYLILFRHADVASMTT